MYMHCAWQNAYELVNPYQEKLTNKFPQVRLTMSDW